MPQSGYKYCYRVILLPWKKYPKRAIFYQAEHFAFMGLEPQPVNRGTQKLFLARVRPSTAVSNKSFEFESQIQKNYLFQVFKLFPNGKSQKIDSIVPIPRKNNFPEPTDNAIPPKLKIDK